MAPRRLERVDPQDQLARRIASREHRRRDGGAGGVLDFGGDGVLEVENETVGGQRAGLFQGTRVGTRHEQDAAAWSKGRAHRNPPFPNSFPI